MSNEITREAAWELLCQWNKEPFHLRHAVTVEGVMRYFAKELGYTDEEELILDMKLDKRNFRKKVLTGSILKELNEFTKVGSKRPARLYSFDNITLNSKRGHFFS